jgi:1,2-diacylglycerol 3-beta-glucosyltransferase
MNTLRDGEEYPLAAFLRFRKGPRARTGKGPALNAAYWQLQAWLPAAGRRDNLIIGVIDADGRPAPDCLEVCAGPALFGNPSVGSVQIEVRMINRDDPRPSTSPCSTAPRP